MAQVPFEEFRSRARRFIRGNIDAKGSKVLSRVRYATFTADDSLAGYASVIDNGTTDPTYFSAMSPSGF